MAQYFDFTPDGKIRIVEEPDIFGHPGARVPVEHIPLKVVTAAAEEQALADAEKARQSHIDATNALLFWL